MTEDRADRRGGPGGVQVQAQGQAGRCRRPTTSRPGAPRRCSTGFSGAASPLPVRSDRNFWGERLAGARKGKRKWVRRGRPRGFTGGAGSSTPRPAGFALSHEAEEGHGQGTDRAGGHGRQGLSVEFGWRGVGTDYQCLSPHAPTPNPVLFLAIVY